MSHFSNRPAGDIQCVQEVVKGIFSQEPATVERVTEGVSTYVYRITCPSQIFYLRILPEEGASFSPEVTVHTRLRQMQVKVPEVIHFEHYNRLLQRSVMVTAEIKGRPLSQSAMLSQKEREAILREAGRDLARISTVPVEGFG